MRRTRITLSIPWDPESEDHPAGWDFEFLLDRLEPVVVFDFAEVPPDPKQAG